MEMLKPTEASGLHYPPLQEGIYTGREDELYLILKTSSSICHIDFKLLALLRHVF